MKITLKTDAEIKLDDTDVICLRGICSYYAANGDHESTIGEWQTDVAKRLISFLDKGQMQKMEIIIGKGNNNGLV